MNPITQSQGNVTIIHDADVVEHFPPQYFDPDYWRDINGFDGEAEEGKGITVFLRDGDKRWAMRHYCRGGGMALLFRDAYFWLGLKRTRPWCEWHLLAEMTKLGLPVPAPVAARVVRSKYMYRADLVMSRIENARVWQDWMLADEIQAQDWQDLGQTIRRFHDAGVCHHDLNIRNIMRTDAGEIYLIDFDQGTMRPGNGLWKRKNLDRLIRSIEKLQNAGMNLHFSESNWRQLLQGYMVAAR